MEAAARPRPARQTTLKIPALLLEGDASTAPAASGPGHRYALGPVPSVESFPGGGELPEAYGTGRLLLTARDPHWLYAHWDFTGAEMKKHNARSADGHLVLRIYKNELVGKPCQEDHVHPESRNWFAHVTEAGTRYQAELGYYDAPGRWVSLAVSRPTLTPPDALSGDTSMRFATIPVEVPFRELLKLVKNAVQENLPLVEVIQQLRAEGHPGLPDTRALGTGRWTPAQERALSEVLSMDSVRRVWMGSLEITELIRSKIERTFSSPQRRSRRWNCPPDFSPAGTAFRARSAGWNGKIFLVQRQCRADHLRRDRAGRSREHRRATDQAAAGRHVQFPLRAAGRKLRATGGGGLGGRGRHPERGVEVQPGQSLWWRGWHPSAGLAAAHAVRRAFDLSGGFG